MDKINPKYYRCTNNTSAEHSFTVGRIYQIVNFHNFQAPNNFIGNDGKPNGWSFNNDMHFTPVSELEWNLQEGIITPIPKQEDWNYLVDILEKYNIK